MINPDQVRTITKNLDCKQVGFFWDITEELMDVWSWKCMESTLS